MIRRHSLKSVTDPSYDLARRKRSQRSTAQRTLLDALIDRPSSFFSVAPGEIEY